MRSRLSTPAPDARPAFVLEDVEGAEFGRIKAGDDGGVPTFSLLNHVKDFSVYRSQAGAGYGVASVEKKEI